MMNSLRSLGILTDDLPLELVQSFNIRPFEIIEDPRSVEQQIAFLLKLYGDRSRIALPKSDGPLTGLFVPITANDFGVECHIFAKVEGLTHFVQILPNFWGVTGVSRPVRTVEPDVSKMELHKSVWPTLTQS